MRILYGLSVRFYYFVIWLVSFFDKKAEEWIKGRFRAENEIRNFEKKNNVIWFHCASLGEFEQGRPVIEAFKSKHPDWSVVVTFFSPSGYLAKRDYELADLVTYLPIDTPKNVDFFMQMIKPELAVFVKYEFWYGYLNSLYRSETPVVFISSTFRSNQLFFKNYGGWFYSHLKNVTQFFVQDQDSKNILVQNGISNVIVSGDTRFDRVLQAYRKNEELDQIDRFKGDNNVLVFGSAWEVEWDIAKLISDELPIGWKVIIAPHEINLKEINAFRKKLTQKSVLFSEKKMDDLSECDFLIVDTIGHLSRIYKYANMAIVGGGFTDGIHNILEPLTFGSPVLFGPCHQKFWEAKAAIKAGVGFEFESAKEGFDLALKLMNTSSAEKIKNSQNCKDFISVNSGATNHIVDYLNELVAD